MRTGSDRIILRFPALISAGTEKTFIFATIKLLFRKHRKQHHRIAPTDWRLIHFLRHKTMKLHYFRAIYSASVISTQFPTFFPCFTKTEIASLRATDFKSSHLTSILRTDSRYDKKVFRPKAVPYTGSARDSAHDGHRFRPRLKTDNDLTGIYYFPSVKTDRCVLFQLYVFVNFTPMPLPLLAKPQTHSEIVQKPPHSFSTIFRTRPFATELFSKSGYFDATPDAFYIIHPWFRGEDRNPNLLEKFFLQNSPRCRLSGIGTQTDPSATGGWFFTRQESPSCRQ